MHRTFAVRRGAAWAVAVVALVGARFGSLVTGRILGGFDITTYSLPNRVQVVEALRGLHLPQWDPLRFGGAPLLANVQVGALYPVNWALLPFQADRGLMASVVLHVAIAAVGVYAFSTRALDTTPVGGAVAAATFALGGFVHAHLGHVEQITTMAWVPWVFLAADRALAAPSFRRSTGGVAVLAGAIALAAVAGHTQYAHMAIAGILVYGLVVSSPVTRLVRLLAGIGLGLAIAAIQVVPSALVTARSLRANGLSYETATRDSLPWHDVVDAIVPEYGSVPSLPVEQWAWLPLAALALAVVGFIARRSKRRAWALAVVGVLALLIALGPDTPVFRVAYEVVPGVDRFRVPARWMLLTTLAVAALAGCGVDAAARRMRALPFVCAALVVIELLVASDASKVLDSRVDAGRLLEEPPVAEALGDHRGRVLSLGFEHFAQLGALRQALRPNTHVLDELRSVDGYDGGLLVSEQWVRAMRDLSGNPECCGTRPLRDNIVGQLDRERFAELHITRAVVHGGRPADEVLPRGSRRLRRVGEVDIWSTPSHGPVFLPGGDVPRGLTLRRDPDDPEQLVVDVPRSAGGRRVVVSEAYAPGWSASKGVELERHHTLLMSFVAPPDGGRVVLDYRAPGLLPGALLSLAGVGATIALYAWGRRGERSP